MRWRPDPPGGPSESATPVRADPALRDRRSHAAWSLPRQQTASAAPADAPRAEVCMFTPFLVCDPWSGVALRLTGERLTLVVLLAEHQDRHGAEQTGVAPDAQRLAAQLNPVRAAPLHQCGWRRPDPVPFMQERQSRLTHLAGAFGRQDDEHDQLPGRLIAARTRQPCPELRHPLVGQRSEVTGGPIHLSEGDRRLEHRRVGGNAIFQNA